MKQWLTKFVSQMQAKQQFSDKLDYIVVDLELTGLDPKKHEIVSAAWIEIRQQKIVLGSARHIVNKDVEHLQQSPVFHGIDHAAINEGERLEVLLDALCESMENKVLVCHNAILDWGFIKYACKHLGKVAKPLAIVDTMKLEKQRLYKQSLELQKDSLTLSQCRARYALPSYQVHNALTDALATAELLLAQTHQIGAGKRLKLADLM